MNRIMVKIHTRRLVGSIRGIFRALTAPPFDPTEEGGPFAPVAADEVTHPSQLCRCPKDQDGHVDDCLWLKAMCQTCIGTGVCSHCHGDGTEPGEVVENRQVH